MLEQKFEFRKTVEDRREAKRPQRVLIISILIILLASVTFQHGWVSVASAAGISLGVYPPIIQINAVPPADVQSPLSIQNQGDDALNVKIELRAFVASDQEDGQIHYITPQEANFADPLILQRVKLYDGANEVTEFQLSPKEKKDLTLRISIPKDSKQSDYYFSVIFLSSAVPFGNTSSSQSVSGIASNVLLAVGESEVSGSIQEFSAPLLVEKGPVPLTVRVKNTSNHFINPKGEIIISNIFGQEIGRVGLLQTNVLSQSVRTIPSSEFADESKDLPDQIAAYWPEKYVIGPYKATLNLALSDKGPLFSRTILFFAFPFKLALGLLISILLLIYIIVKVRAKV